MAYAAGNYKAATNLHDLIAQGVIESNSRSKEVIDIVKDLIARGIPGGHYDMGHYLEIGYGVKQDTSSANAYFRKAADQGNPDAQFYVAGSLLKFRIPLMSCKQCTNARWSKVMGQQAFITLAIQKSLAVMLMRLQAITPQFGTVTTTPHATRTCF